VYRTDKQGYQVNQERIGARATNCEAMLQRFARVDDYILMQKEWVHAPVCLIIAFLLKLNFKTRA
jgi:hypothetical protein